MSNRSCTVQVSGISPYSPAKGLDPEAEYQQKKGENPNDFEKRVWREKAHFDGDKLVIPATSVQIGLYMAAKSLNLKFGKKAAAGFVESGTIAMGDHSIVSGDGKPIMKDSLVSTRLFLPSDGKALHKGGKGTRVWRIFPIIHEWKAVFTVELLHEELQRKEVMEPLFEQFGRFVGIGRFRPERGGFCGRFTVNKLSLS